MSKVSIEQAQWLVLQARAHIIARDDVPRVWLQRAPFDDEVEGLRILLSNIGAEDKLAIALSEAEKMRNANPTS